MKTTKQLLDESRERGKARFADHEEIWAKSFSIRSEVRRANEEIGQEAMGAVTFGALGAAESALQKVDQAIDALEHLRMEVIQIAIGERWHQTERPPQIDDLARELGELTALLKVREMLGSTEEAR